MKPVRAIEWATTAVLLAALVTSLAGCGGQKTSTSVAFHDTNPLPVDTLTYMVDEIGTYGGRFVIGETIGPKTFNGLIANETSTTDVTQRMFASLIDFNNHTQQDVPMLAKSWEVAADGVTWTFHLRHGARFSDGHPLTAADAMFSYEVALDSIVHPSAQDGITMNGKPFVFAAPDSYTIVVTTPSPNVLVPSLVSNVVIMPKHILEAAYRAGTFSSAYNLNTSPDSIVTSGPWRMKQYVPGEKTVLSRNPYWFGVDSKGQRLPYLNEVVYLSVPDQDALDLKFRSGEVDGLDNPKPDNYTWYAEHQKEGHFTFYDLGPRMSTNFFWFNLNKVRRQLPNRKLGEIYVDPVKYAWFNNADFRRAVSMAIDRDAMVTSIFFGSGVKNWSTMTPGNKVWYNPNVRHFDQNIEESKKLLAGLGWKDKDGDGFLEDTHGHTISFSLKTNSDNRLRIAMGNFIKDDLAKVGVKVTLVPAEFNTLITNLRENFDYEAILLGLESATPPDPGQGGNVWRSSGRTHYWNMTQPHPESAAEARMDALMDVIVSTNDVAQRHAAWEEIENTVNEQGWIVWLPTLVLKIPVRNRFGNLQPSVIPHRLLWNIDRVFVKANAQGA